MDIKLQIKKLIAKGGLSFLALLIIGPILVLLLIAIAGFGLIVSPFIITSLIIILVICFVLWAIKILKQKA